MNSFTRRDLLGCTALLSALGPAAVAAGESAGRAPPKAPAPPARAVLTGGARTVRVDGKYDVFVKHVGPARGLQVLTLHGGPGFPHFYLECFEDFLPAADVGFWYYDQLGCGFSDQPDDKSLWNIDRFREEVEQVRKALDLDKFVLFGHSWGGMLALEYALKYPQHLGGLVISNMTASSADYVTHVNELRAAMPAPVRARLDAFEAKGDFSSPEYEKLIWGELYHRHICRLDPWPEPVERAARMLSEPVYNTIQGSDEFHVTGNMRDWNRWHSLPDIDIPALVIGARYDTMRPSELQKMAKDLPKGRSFICGNGSHLAMYDDQQAYFAALTGFLHSLPVPPRTA